MRVLHPTTTFPRHPDDHWGPFVLDLCNAIAERGVDVEVLASNGPDAGPIDAACDITRFDYFLGRRFQTLMTPPGLIPNLKNRPWRAVQLPFFYWALGDQIRKRSSDADLVHAHWLIPTGFAAVRNSDAPVVATVWGAEYHVSPGSLMGRLVRRAQDRVDHLVAVSSYLRERGIERFGADPEEITVIPNAVDADRFRPDREGAIRERFGIAPEKRLVVTVRRLVPEKRVSDLVRAAASFPEDAVVVVVGDGPQRGSLEELASREGVEDRVVFTGYLPHEEIPDVLAAADVFALTTEQEGMATALLEAMACGAVPVATDAVGNDEVIEDEVSGRLYPPGDVGALADAVREVLGDEEDRSGLAEAARERILANFSYDVVAEQYVDIYERLV